MKPVTNKPEEKTNFALAKENPEVEGLMTEETRRATLVEPDKKPESDEVAFLHRLLSVQHEGGWGKHLDGIINERIKELTK